MNWFYQLIGEGSNPNPYQMAIRALSDFLKIYFISELHFVNENIILVLNTITDIK